MWQIRVTNFSEISSKLKQIPTEITEFLLWTLKERATQNVIASVICNLEVYWETHHVTVELIHSQGAVL